MIIFISFLRKICNKKLKEVKDSEKSTMKQAKQQLIVAVTLSILFGLGWGIGLPATQAIPSSLVIRDVFASLFVIFTAFQGLFVFIMHCVRSPDVRSLWAGWFKLATGKEPSEFTSSVVSRTRKKPSTSQDTKSTSFTNKGHKKADEEFSFSTDDGLATLKHNVKKSGLMNPTSTLERFAKDDYLSHIEEEDDVVIENIKPHLEFIEEKQGSVDQFEEDIQHSVKTYELPEGVFGYNFDSASIGGMSIVSEEGKECVTFENPMELLQLDDPFKYDRLSYSASQHSFRSENFVDITQTSFINPMVEYGDDNGHMNES